MAPTVVAVAAAEVVAKTAVVTEAAMSSAVAPSRSLGGRESCDGECGEGGESEDAGTDFHGNLLWVDVRGSRVDRFGRSFPSLPTHHRGFDGFSPWAFVKGKSPSENRSGFKDWTQPFSEERLVPFELSLGSIPEALVPGMVHALTRVASGSVTRLARSFAVAGLLDRGRGRNVGRRSFAVACFLTDPHRHFDANRDFDAIRNRDFDAHWHSDGDFDRHVDTLLNRDRLRRFATATLFAAALVTAAIRAVAYAVAAAPAAAVAAKAIAITIAVAAVAPAVAPAVMAPTVVTITAVVAPTVVAITAVVTEAVSMAMAMSPSRSLGGRESCDGECGEGCESEDAGTNFHGNLLWVDVRGSMS
jgi:hypothetical protein